MENMQSCSCCVRSKEDLPPLENPIDKNIHFCLSGIETGGVCKKGTIQDKEDDGDCIGRKDGSFWIVDNEYHDRQVNFCPHCGAQSPNQNKSDTN